MSEGESEEGSGAARTRSAHLLLFATLLLLLPPPPVLAQAWTLDAYGGRVAYDRAGSSPAETSALLGVRYGGAGVGEWLYASAGLPLGSDDSVWGAGGLGARWTLDLGPAELGADLGAHGYLYRDPAFTHTGRGGTLEARPLLAFGSRPVRVELRSGWVGYASEIAAAGFTRHAHDSDVNLHLAPAYWIRLTGTARHLRAQEDDYTFFGGRVSLGSGRLRGWGSAGAWSSDLIPTTEWAVGGSWSVDAARRTWLTVSLRQDASDPVYWNAPRERWSLGLSHTLGGSRSAGETTIPERLRHRDRAVTFAPAVSAGRVTFRLPADEVSGAPSVAGEFTDWEPAPMRQEDGAWVASFRLDSGSYRYAYRSESGEWFVPEETPGRKPDGFGGWVAVVVVP